MLIRFEQQFYVLKSIKIRLFPKYENIEPNLSKGICKKTEQKTDVMSRLSPFDDILVVDFTHVLAGPACSYYLGLLGARIIKIESDQKGDGIRFRGGTDKQAATEGMSTAYLTQGAGKQALALDLTTARGREIMERLLSKADVFVENHLPETMKRLNLDEQTVTALHPHLIYCSLTGYGRGDAQGNVPAYDVNIQAASGLMDMTGTAETGPTRTGAPILDYSTALSAAFAVSSALFQRGRTGQGSFIDVSMLETALTLMSSTVTDYLKTGNEPKRRGNLANSRSPGAGNFPCQRGIISLGVNEEQHFRNLAKALSREDWLRDPRYADRQQRQAHIDQFVSELEAELIKYDAAEVEVVLQQHGVPAARVRTMKECLDSEQIAQRNYIHSDPVTGLKTPGLPFRIDGEAFIPSSPAPRHGEDTDDIIKWLYGEN